MKIFAFLGLNNRAAKYIIMVIGKVDCKADPGIPEVYSESC